MAMAYVASAWWPSLVFLLLAPMLRSLVITKATGNNQLLSAVVQQRYQAMHRVKLAPAYAITAQQAATQSTVFCAVHLDEIVGSVEMLTRGAPTHDQHIVNLVVSPSFRRSGVATALLDTVIASSGALTLTLSVDDDNTAAIRLYTKKGFERQPHPAPAKRASLFGIIPLPNPSPPRRHYMVYNPHCSSVVASRRSGMKFMTWRSAVASLWNGNAEKTKLTM